jgi:prophage DNA circulation protein
MPAPFDTFKSFSFAGVKIPYKSYKIKGAYRKHIHEYPHANGGAPEKLGRSLYEVTVTYEANSGDFEPPYNQMLQDLTSAFHNLWESGTTDLIHVPHIGSFKAFADEWDEECHNTNRSGVLTTVKFVEDQTEASLIFEGDKKFFTSAKEAAKDVAIQTDQLTEGKSIWSSINDVAIQVFGFVDQASLYGALIAAKIESLTALLRHADATVKSLGDPENWEIREALDRFRETILDLQDDILKRDRLLREYEVQFTMSVGQVSAAVYGDYTRGGEIMQLNILPDPLQIRPGTVIRYYQAA